MDTILPLRQQQILISLVNEFISTAEPVGSRTMMGKLNIQASPSTIRNEMAKLEKRGYLFQPHTSSGRIPTDKAYRYYVDFLMQRQIVPPGNLDVVLHEYKSLKAHLEKLVDYTGKLLADLTKYMSLVLVPRFRKTLFRYLKITPLDHNRILLILMTNTGSVLNKVIHLSRDVNEEKLKKMTEILNKRLSGMFLGDITLELLSGIPGDIHQGIIERLSELTREMVVEKENTVIYGGARHLLDLPEFQDLDRLRTIFQALDEEKVVVEILNKTLAYEGLKIYIGREHHLDEMKECSFITATYGLGGIPLGAIAILGPTRMPYERIIPVVSSFADIFSEKLAGLADLWY